MRQALIIALAFFVFSKPVFASDPPLQISPANNSIVSSSSLKWQPPTYPLYSPKPYTIQVDNNQDFSTPEKDYDTANNYYTPSLEEGLWYWRIKVKDASGVWSDWSSVWNFTLVIPSPSPTLSASPSPTQYPTPTPSPTPLPSPSPSPTTTTSQFIISDVPNQINFDQSFNVKVTLSIPGNPNTIYYLKGAFKKADGTRYLGLTKKGSEWIEYGEEYLEQYKITTDASGNWTGSLEVKPDILDNDYKGAGDYIFKIARLTSSGSIWSNESKITIISLSSPSPSLAPSPSTSSLPTPVPTPSNVEIIDSTPSSKPSPSDEFTTLSKTDATPEATVAGIEIQSDKKQNTTNNFNILTIIGGLFIIATPIGWYLRSKYL